MKYVNQETGIINYTIGKNGAVKYKWLRKAKPLNRHDSSLQIYQLPLKYLRKESSLSCDRKKLVDYFLKTYSKNQINNLFKIYYKANHYANWKFLKDNYKQILPIDYQWFYSRKMHLTNWYCGTSSFGLNT